MNEELKIIIKAVTDGAKKELSAVKDELKEVKEQGEKSGKAISNAMAMVKKAVAATITTVVALTTALVVLGKATDEFRKAQAKVTTTFATMGSSAKQATQTFGDLYRFLGDTDKAAETAQSLALITTEEEKLAEWTKILQGAYAQMGDKLPTEGLAEAANETIRVGKVSGVMADALSWVGVSEDAFNASLEQTVSLEEREALVRSTLNNLYGAAASNYENANIATLRLNESQFRLNQAMADAAVYTTPLRTALNNLSATLFSTLAPAIKTISVYLTAFIELLTSAIQTVGGLFGGVKGEAKKASEETATYAKAMDNYSGSIGDGFNKATSGAKETSEAIDKIKKQTMGFDELNILSSPDKSQTTTAAPVPSGIAGGIGGIGDISGGLLGGESLIDLQAVEEAKEKLKDILPYIAAVASAFVALFVIDKAKNFAKVLGDIGTKIKGMSSSLGGISLIVAGVVLLVSGIKDVAENGYSMEAVLKILAGTIGVVVGAILLFNSALLANPITWIVIAIAGLVAGFVILWNECEGFRNFWINLWENIKIAFSKFVDTLQPLINAIVGAFKEAWELIKVIWLDYLVPMFKAAWEAIKKIWDFVKPYFEMVWNNIKIVFSVVKEVLGNYFKLAWEYIKAIWNVVVAYFTAVWNSIKGIFAVVKNVLKGNWSEAWEAIKGIVDGWKKYFQTVWDSIKKIFSAVKTFFKDSFGAAWDGVKAIFANVGSFFTGIWNKIKDIFSKVGSTIGNAVSNAFATAINWVLEKAIGIINGFISAINAAISVINKIPGVDIKKISKLEVPKLAKGGIVDNATLAMIGERGKEAVLPLENNTGWMDTLADRIASRSNTPSKIVLMVDGKALGEATINSINGITRQTGKLQLSIF